MAAVRCQPAKRLLREQRWTTAAAAREIGVAYAHLANCLNGRTRPEPRVRERLPELLGVPLDRLFEPRLLEKPFQPHRPGEIVEVTW